jgi:sugar lactone lactonase YvrE
MSQLPRLGVLVVLACLCLSAHAQTAQFSGTQSNVVSYMGIVSLSSQYSFYTAGVTVDGSGNVYIAHGCYTSPSAPANSPPDCTVWKETPSAGGYTQSTIAVGFPYSPTNDSYTVPGQVAVDSQGNVYVTDNHYLTAGYSNSVWKETPSGSGYTNSVVASLAPGKLAFGVAVDGSGNVYWTDAVNGNVWKETLSAGVYTETLLAGGFGYPNGVAVDSSGSVYIADEGTSAVLPNVWKETPSAGGYTATSVGTGMTAPGGVAVDASGNVYVSDDGLYKETLSAGAYTQSMVPIFTPGYAYGSLALSNEIAVDSSGNVYIADTGNQRVVKETGWGANFGPANVGSTNPSPITAVFTFDVGSSLGAPALLTKGAKGLDFTDAGTGTCTAGSLFYPENVCAVVVNFTPTAAGTRYGAVELLDGTGNALATGYVQGTGVGSQVNFLPGRQSPVANAAPDGLSQPQRVAVDGSGNVYIADSNNNQVLKETLSAGVYIQSVVANSANNGLSLPVGIAVDGSGNVYIADNHNYRVLKETLSAGSYTQSVVANGANNGLDYPNDVAVDGSGNVYIADTGNNRVLKETLSAGSYTQSVVADSSTNGLNSPDGVAVDGNGSVYIVDFDEQVLKETLSAGSYTQSVISNSSGISSYCSLGVAVDGSGNLYIADCNTNQVLKETLSAGNYNQSVVANGATNGLTGPTGVAVDSSGNVYIADTTNSRVLKEDFADPPQLTFAPTAVGSTSTDSPQTVTVENIGNAPLTFPVPSTGSNPSISTSFILNSSAESACPVVSSGSSAAATLAAGTSCLLPIGFAPGSVGSFSGALTLTDNNLNAAGPNYAIQMVSLSGTGALSQAQLSSPTAGSTLAGPSVTFDWTAASGATGYYLWIGSTGAGSNNIYNSAEKTVTSYTFSGMPLNGETIYVRLITSTGGKWISNDYTYTAATAAAMTSPTLGAVFTGPTATFTWTAATGSFSGYYLLIGSTGAGSNNIYNSAEKTVTSYTFNNLPTNGETINVRLITNFNGVWVHTDYTYIAATAAAMTSPTAGSTFTGASVTFNWTTIPSATGYYLEIGSTGAGSNDIYNSAEKVVTTYAFTRMPTNGETIYVRLNTNYSGVWVHNDYTYKAYTLPAMLTAPTPESTLAGASVTFDWTAPSGATGYYLEIGSTGVGSNDIYNSAEKTVTTYTFTHMPTNGETIYVRLITNYNGTWVHNDYTYTSAE